MQYWFDCESASFQSSIVVDFIPIRKIYESCLPKILWETRVIRYFEKPTDLELELDKDIYIES